VLPANRNGTIADLTVDRSRGNIFLSNINYGRLEVWQADTALMRTASSSARSVGHDHVSHGPEQ